MRRIFPLFFLALAACTSPLQQCVEQAEADYRGLLTAIAIAERNIERGYAVDRQIVPYRGIDFCAGTGFRRDRVGLGLTTCRDTRLRTVATPVPLDLEAEERKLASMQARLPGARELRDRRIAACYARFGG